MKKRLKQFIVLLFVIAVTSLGSRSATAQSQTVAQIVAGNEYFGKFNWAIGMADLGPMLNGPGPYTIFVPTDGAMAQLDTRITENPGLVRQLVLNHILIGAHDSASLSQRASIKTAFGKDLTIQQGNPMKLNEIATIRSMDIAGTNGVVHIIDAVLNPHAFAVEAELDPSAPPEPSNVTLSAPEANPAYVSGGYIAYWFGVRMPSNVCRGMTWVLLRQVQGVATVGADRKTNPYRGDTNCDQSKPVLCIKRDFTPAPEAYYAQTWASGKVRITGLIKGTALESRGVADEMCKSAFGQGWRMAEFHDANMGYGAGNSSGWSFSAEGGLPINQRFWVAISNQPANPWNSYQQLQAPPGSSGGTGTHGGDGAFVGGNRILPADVSGRRGCNGTTWVIHRQGGGLVLVGADAKTNPYYGDESCSSSLPVLCIRVDGYAPPASYGGNNYSKGWSGGVVRLSRRVVGSNIASRDAANNVCVGSFGSAWRMATHHDGSLGTGGTDGWAFWAYGALQSGTRFWVGVNDQKANPWNGQY